MTVSLEVAVASAPRVGSSWVAIGLLVFAAAYVQAQAAPERRPPGPMPVPKALAIQRGSTKVTVDASLQDWPQCPPLRLDDLRQLSGTAHGSWRGPEDSAARFYLMWDDEALWIAGEVRDDWHQALTKDRPKGLEVPPCDAVVLTIDPRRDTETLGADGGRTEDCEFWLGDSRVDDKERLVSLDRLRGLAGYVDGGRVVVRRDDEKDLTNYEARIPWSAILPPGADVQAGYCFDMQLVVCDYDEPTDALPQTRVGWSFGAGAEIEPGLMGSVLLAGSGVTTLQQELPASPEGKPSSNADSAIWVEFLADLRRTNPSVFGVDSPDPRFVGGEIRHRLLHRLEDALAELPRTDHVRLAHRVSRRMRREAAGMSRHGLPFFWHHTAQDIARQAMDPPPDGYSFRLFRLPQGGWMVRSKWGNFGVDPVGYDIENLLWGGMEFVLLTSPLDTTARNDELLVRMAKVDPQRPVYTHLFFHLPGVPADEFRVARPGDTYRVGGFEITPHVSADESGALLAVAGYSVRFPNGALLVFSGPALLEEELRKQEIDLLVLDARHGRARVVGQRLDADFILLSGHLQAQGPVRWGPRVDLESAYELQTGLLPKQSAILAPGEWVDGAPR